MVRSINCGLVGSSGAVCCEGSHQLGDLLVLALHSGGQLLAVVKAATQHRPEHGFLCEGVGKHEAADPVEQLLPLVAGGDRQPLQHPLELDVVLLLTVEDAPSAAKLLDALTCERFHGVPPGWLTAWLDRPTPTAMLPYPPPGRPNLPPSRTAGDCGRRGYPRRRLAADALHRDDLWRLPPGPPRHIGTGPADTENRSAAVPGRHTGPAQPLAGRAGPVCAGVLHRRCRSRDRKCPADRCVTIEVRLLDIVGALI
jgi:hypothetical protein